MGNTTRPLSSRLPSTIALGAALFFAAGCSGADPTDALDGDAAVPMTDAAPTPGDCSSATCLNGACEETAAGALCACDRHFVGDACDECALGYAGGACDECAEGFMADATGACVADPCAAETCGDRGSCEPSTDPTGGASTTCRCDEGFAGDACGECAEGYTGAECADCADGFTRDGGRCVAVACVEIVCGRRGTCSDLDGDGEGECVCERGWDGRSCEDCLDGYSMVDGECVPDVCDGFACDHGTCEAEGSLAVCTCDAGWTGDGCDSCAVGYVETEGRSGIRCENRLTIPAADPLLAAYDAANLPSVDTDGEGYLEQWFQANDFTDSFWTNQQSYRRPRQVVLPPAIELDGVDDQMENLSAPIRTDNHYTIIMVASWDPAGGPQMLYQGWLMPTLDIDISAEGYSLEALDAHRVIFRHDGDGDGTRDVVTSTDFDAASGRQLIIAERRPFLAGTAHGLSDGDVDTTVEGDEPALVVNAMGILGNTVGDQDDRPLDGSVHELIFYRGALTTEQRQAVIDYLTVKWSL